MDVFCIGTCAECRIFSCLCGAQRGLFGFLRESFEIWLFKMWRNVECLQICIALIIKELLR